MLTPNMQGIIMAIGKARNVYDRCGPEAGFFKVQLTFSTFFPLTCLVRCPFSLHPLHIKTVPAFMHNSSIISILHLDISPLKTRTS